ncbi:MAG TPA: SPFH domain-containing protein [Candidatus Acidoferrum sp.]|nr:SPFH domain-containing protein [Candidatus Acidoferrum sp.]
MNILKLLLVILGIGLFGSAGALVVYDVVVAAQLRRLLRRKAELTEGALSAAAFVPRPFGPVRWQRALQLAGLGALPLLISESVAVVPDGFAGVRLSQIWGVRPGTLYPGVHLVTPLIDSVALYDTREQTYSTSATSPAKAGSDLLTVQAREGLVIGIAVSVRYRLDPSKLTAIHSNLPQPVGQEVVAPVVSTIYRQLAPNYETREVFALKQEELRTKAADQIKARLASDGIVVREVLLRDISLPAEYAKGLEGLLLKEQENEQLETVTQIKQKEVKIAELEAEAQKSRDVKQAEAQAQVQVLQAKAQSDAMQYTLPLKQKQIEQSKLEAEARKEATLQNAEAAAQAKIIDSKAEIERQRNLADAEANRIRVTADAEANRIRVTAAADSERMKFEAAVLKQNPMLIQKIIAERLSDKLQIMMVPVDGKNFFANDVFRSAFNGSASGAASGEEDAEGDSPASGLTAQKRGGRKP